MKPNIFNFYRVSSSIRGTSLVVQRKIKKGQIVFDFNALKPQSLRTYQTVEIGNGYHVVEEFLAKLNHSCDPTTFIDTKQRLCIAARDIEKGKELNFLYPSTEIEMIQPFECKCGAISCIKYVTGARALPLHFLIGRPLNPHVVKFLTAAKFCEKYIA